MLFADAQAIEPVDHVRGGIIIPLSMEAAVCLGQAKVHNGALVVDMASCS